MARCWCIRVQGGCARAMEEAEGFFLTLGASIVRRDASSLDAVCVHPDGLQSSIAVNYATKGTGEEALLLGRSSGDPTLFDEIGRMLLEFDMGRGRAPEFFNGQVLPRIHRQTYSPPMDVPPLNLDQAGVKRKQADR